LDIIKDKTDGSFVLDNHGYIGVFESGYRENKDKRLEFETFVTFLQQIQKSFQFENKSKEGIDQDLKLVKNLNNLSNSTDYEKKYIVYWGYKFEDPTCILQLNFDKNEVGKSLNIRKYADNGKSSTLKNTPNRSVSVPKVRGELMADIKANLKNTRKEVREEHLSDIKTNLKNSRKETKTKPSVTRKSRSIKHPASKPIAIQKDQLSLEEDDPTISENSGSGAKVAASKSITIEPTQSFKIAPSSQTIKVAPSKTI
jgi:hypothetical protein